MLLLIVVAFLIFEVLLLPLLGDCLRGFLVGETREEGLRLLLTRCAVWLLFAWLELSESDDSGEGKGSASRWRKVTRTEGAGRNAGASGVCRGGGGRGGAGSCVCGSNAA